MENRRIIKKKAPYKKESTKKSGEKAQLGVAVLLLMFRNKNGWEWFTLFLFINNIFHKRNNVDQDSTGSSRLFSSTSTRTLSLRQIWSQTVGTMDYQSLHLHITQWWKKISKSIFFPGSYRRTWVMKIKRRSNKNTVLSS